MELNVNLYRNLYFFSYLLNFFGTAVIQGQYGLEMSLPWDFPLSFLFAVNYDFHNHDLHSFQYCCLYYAIMSWISYCHVLILFVLIKLLSCLDSVNVLILLLSCLDFVAVYVLIVLLFIWLCYCNILKWLYFCCVVTWIILCCDEIYVIMWRDLFYAVTWFILYCDVI